MPSFIIVEKSGSVKVQSVKNFNKDELYKKCGFKTAEGFSCMHTWNVEFNDIKYSLEVYGKTNGKANTENKYEFPPPIDNVLFFGNCAVVLLASENVVDLGENEFKDIMDHLYGGYDDLENDDDEDDEDEDDSDLPKTKHGYVKDDFVVSSDAEDDDDFSEEEEEPVSEDEIVKASKKKVKKVEVEKIVPEKIKKPTKPKLRKKDEKAEPEYVECTEELTEDPYIE